MVIYFEVPLSNTNFKTFPSTSESK